MNTSAQQLLETARTLPSEQLPRFLGELEEIRATALARLTTPPAPQSRDELLDVDAAAERLGMSPDYLYRNHSKLPFTRRMGRSLLFSSLGIDEYIRRGRPKT